MTYEQMSGPWQRVADALGDDVAELLLTRDWDRLREGYTPELVDAVRHGKWDAAANELGDVESMNLVRIAMLDSVDSEAGVLDAARRNDRATLDRVHQYQESERRRKGVVVPQGRVGMSGT